MADFSKWDRGNLEHVASDMLRWILHNTEANQVHPYPWRVEYSKLCKGWHAKSSPRIVDAKGRLVVQMPQHVDHPGMHDDQADSTAITIVDCVNAASGQITALEADGK